MDYNCRPFIDFIITKKCNYACPYCSQSKLFSKNNNHAKDDVIDGFLSALSKLQNRSYEITITGGEPLLHPRFYEVIDKISKMGYKVSIVSNLSAPIEKYRKIIDILGDSLSLLMFSVHTDSVKDLNLLLDKVVTLKASLHRNSAIKVCAPLWNNMPKLKYLLECFSKHGIEFEVQHIRLANSYVDYTDEEQKFINSNSNLKNKSINTFANLCYSGNKSAVVYEDGEVYRCYSSRFLKAHSLGNIKKGEFNFYDSPKSCPLLSCTCPKPYQYGMITKNKNYFSALSMVVKNILYLPAVFLGKKEVLLEKIKQKINLKKS